MKIENDIQKALIRNSLVVYGLCFITLATIAGAFMYSHSIIKEARKVLYLVKTDGDIIPLELADQRENMIIEMKHHLVLFTDFYYNLEQGNYQTKTAKALWLGDLVNDYAAKKNGGYYSPLLQMNMERIAALPAENIELFESGNAKVGFKITIQIIERVGESDRKLLLFARGTMKQVARNFPYNPHGFFIENYIEDKIIEVQ